jgi:hypothetical protein
MTVWPEIDPPVYLPEELVSWAGANRDLLERIVVEVLEQGSWPETKPMTRALAREGVALDVTAAVRGMPRGLGFADGFPERAVLLLFGLRLTSGGQGLLAAYVAALRIAAEKFESEEEPPMLTRAELALRGFFSAEFLTGLSEILFREAPFLGNKHGAPDEEWTAEVTTDIVRYWDVFSADRYLQLRAEEFNLQPGPVLSLAIPQPPIHMEPANRHDLFLSHAGEDKDGVATPLAEELERLGHSVWFDRSELVVGDSLTDSINGGLAGSRFGLVVLSPSFFAKPWPRRELDALFALMIEGETRILPVWHGIDEAFLAENAPLLLPLLAADTKNGIGAIATEISAAIKRRSA